jgi:hypothetical protein
MLPIKKKGTLRFDLTVNFTADKEVTLQYKLAMIPADIKNTGTAQFGYDSCGQYR